MVIDFFCSIVMPTRANTIRMCWKCRKTTKWTLRRRELRVASQICPTIWDSERQKIRCNRVSDWCRVRHAKMSNNICWTQINTCGSAVCWTPHILKTRTAVLLSSMRCPMGKLPLSSGHNPIRAFRAGNFYRHSWSWSLAPIRSCRNIMQQKTCTSVKCILKSTQILFLEYSSMSFAVSSILGAVLTINCFRFKIVHADAAVYHYMQENSEMFSPEVIEGVRRDVSAASGAHLMEEVIPIFVPLCSHNQWFHSPQPASKATENQIGGTLTKKVSFAEDEH